MAKIWDLPVVYVIENNHYGMGTSIERASANLNLSQRGLSFNIPGEQVDAMDVRAVRAAGVRAVERARGGKGPFILEMLTYRYRGHSMSDPAKYRSREEVQKIKDENDPIDRSRARILEDGHATTQDLKLIETEIKEIVAEAVEFAKTSPQPDPSELYADVYA
jgi:pyruvate dehydrogenase E1 component alpha subunit